MTILEKIARIKVDFAGNPPPSLVRVLEDLLETCPPAELEKAIDQAVVNAKQLLAGEKWRPPPGALEICDGPAREEAA